MLLRLVISDHGQIEMNLRLSLCHIASYILRGKLNFTYRLLELMHPSMAGVVGHFVPPKNCPPDILS